MRKLFAWMIIMKSSMKTDAEYRIALQDIEYLQDAPSGTLAFTRLTVLNKRVDDYEEFRWPASVRRTRH